MKSFMNVKMSWFNCGVKEISILQLTPVHELGLVLGLLCLYIGVWRDRYRGIEMG